ncbi:MAG: alkaline phosphatase family protein [Microthrixaceae bacterium]|nr:alkaline phosphatase family protein [Microthrixaceae bacterium]
MHSDSTRAALAEIESILTDASFGRQVEMVLSCPDTDTYRAASSDGSVTFRREAVDGRYRYAVAGTTGLDPLADRSTARFDDHRTERASRFPARSDNTYPHGFDSIAQFFDGTHAPDAVVLHTAGHRFNEHLGQHGSLGVVQARGPFIAAGRGIRNLGPLDRSTRTVHVAPTIAALMGLNPHPHGVGADGEHRPDALLRRQDGDPEAAILSGDRAEHVVVFLLDGCNANLLHDVMSAGEAPNISALAERGTQYRHGLMASLPTATLANHTTAVTGAHPGHSGVLHNRWLDRGTGRTPDLLELDQMISAMRHLDPCVETIFQAIQRSRPGAFSTASFEFCDTGASFSSFGLLRDGHPPTLPEGRVSHLDADAAATSHAYRFMSGVDHTSAAHTIAAWERTEGNPLPALSWCSFALTDEAGHESGPHGEAARAAVRDTDGRIGDVVAAVERSGLIDRTAFFVIADHGMEQCDPTNDLLWNDALGEAAAPHLDLDGFIYLRR